MTVFVFYFHLHSDIFDKNEKEKNVKRINQDYIFIKYTFFFIHQLFFHHIDSKTTRNMDKIEEAKVSSSIDCEKEANAFLTYC
jgi:hypothetical protein